MDYSMPVDVSNLFKTINMAFVSANGFISLGNAGSLMSEIIFEENKLKVKILGHSSSGISTSFNNLPCSLCVVGTY